VNLAIKKLRIILNHLVQELTIVILFFREKFILWLYFSSPIVKATFLSMVKILKKILNAKTFEVKKNLFLIYFIHSNFQIFNITYMIYVCMLYIYIRYTYILLRQQTNNSS